MQKSKSGPACVGRLMESVIHASGEQTVRSAFQLDVSLNRFGMIDEIKRQFKEYQTEIIPDDFFKATGTQMEKCKARKETSYWKGAYANIGIEIEKEKDMPFRLDNYWLQVR